MADENEDATAAETAPVPDRHAPAASDQVEALAAEAGIDDEKATEEDTRPFVMVRDRKFHLRQKLPGIIMLRLSASADSKTSIPKQMSAIYEFLTRAVVQEEVDDFLAFLEDAEPEIEMDEISDILERAVEEIGSGTPT